MNPRRLVLTLYVVLLTGLGVGATALFHDAWKEYSQLKQTETEARRRLADAQARLAEQEKVLERLRTDRDYVEKVIRKRLNYAKPGEVIFRFEN